MRILMIEDDGVVSELVSQFVTVAFNEEACVEVVADLSAADECLKERVYDLIVLDVMLPDGNGLHWLRQQAMIANQQVPVIVLSAHTEAESLLDSMKIGTAQFLSKTISNYAVLPDMIDECIEARFVGRDLARANDQSHVA